MKNPQIQTMVNSLWSFTSMRWYPERCLQPLLEGLTESVSKMKSVELCNTLWVCARLGHHPGEAMLELLDARIQLLVSVYLYFH